MTEHRARASFEVTQMQPEDQTHPHSRRPAILVVDDEPTVLAAVSRDLRRGFGERFRVLRAGSGPQALELLRELGVRGDQVAMLIADQRMPGMSGTEYLSHARNTLRRMPSACC